ncbi:MAG: hypothetical protein IJU37_04355 [Desulfovibrio sp.]|nr:hypothetical protein [Desulfovibrio sp.]
MQKAANLKLAGLNADNIRQELHAFLRHRKGNGSTGERSQRTRSFVVSNLMKIWASPAPELIPLRDATLAFLRENPSMTLAAHWAMISAAYPFWFNVARQTGRLLSIQDQVAKPQIIQRLKEHYGDRQTVSRYAQFVIRSCVAWGALQDSKAKGCYEKADLVYIAQPDMAILLLESALQATPTGRCAMGLLLNSPAFFPFKLPVMTADMIAQQSERIDVILYGSDEALLTLKG